MSRIFHRWEKAYIFITICASSVGLGRNHFNLQLGLGCLEKFKKQLQLGLGCLEKDKKQLQGPYRVRTGDLLICSQMLYHWAKDPFWIYCLLLFLKTIGIEFSSCWTCMLDDKCSRNGMIELVAIAGSSSTSFGGSKWKGTSF